MIMQGKSQSQTRQSMIGESIQQVIYYSPHNQSSALISSKKAASHTVDRAVLFKMHSETWYGFFHGTEFEQQGIDIVFNPYEATKIANSDIDFWDASQHRNWKPLVGKQIIHIEPLWHDDASPLFTLYPMAMRITLENNKQVHICVPHLAADVTSFWTPCEDIMIIFDETMANGYLELVR